MNQPESETQKMRFYARLREKSEWVGLSGTMFFLYFFSSVILNYLPLWLEKERGMDLATRGVLLSLAPLTAIAGPLLMGRLADRSGNMVRLEKLLVSAIMLGATLFIVAKGFWPLLFLMLFYNLGIYTLGPLNDVVFLRRTAALSINFGRIRMLGTAGFVLGGVLIGALSARRLDIMFLLQVMLGAIMLFFLRFVPAVPGECRPQQKFNAKKFLLRKEILILFLFMGALYLTMGFHYSYYPNYFAVTLGAGTGLYSLMISLNALMEFPVLLFLNRLFRRAPLRLLLAVAGGIFALRWLLTGLSYSPFVHLLLALTNGPSQIALFYAMSFYLSATAPPEGRATAVMMGNIATNGIARFIGSVTGPALLAAAGSMSRVYVFFGAFVALAVALLLLARPQYKTAEDFV